jgi:DNA-binding MurR/RpiR family transcriptional regulator
MDLFDRIYSRSDALTRGEARLAAALLAEPSRIAFESAAALGAPQELSAATVVRFFAKLGCSSLMEAQHEHDRRPLHRGWPPRCPGGA